MKKHIVGLIVCITLGFMSFLTSSASAQFVYSGTMVKSVSQSHHTIGNISYSNAGDIVTYTLLYTNNSTGSVSIVLNDNAPSNLNIPLFFGVTSSIPGCTVANTVNNNITSSNCIVGPGLSGTFVITALVSSSTPPYTGITNTGLISVYNPSDLINPIATHTSSAVFFSYPRLSINKTIIGNLPQINQSGTIVQSDTTYQITIINSGSTNATGIILSDIVPFGWNLISIFPINGTPSISLSGLIIPSNTYFWTGLTIPANTMYTYNITIRLTNILANPGSGFTNTGTIATGFNMPGAVIDTGVSAVTSTILGVPSISMMKSIISGAVTYQSGDLVTYQITLTNTGTASVTGTITDIWPIHLNFISSSIPQSAVSGQTITWSGFTIPAGGTGVITLTGRLNSNYPANTPYTNTVTYTCLSPSVCNNPTSSVTGTIVGFSAVSMTKTIIAPNVSGHVSGSGDLVTYRITVSNTGTAGVTGRINDTFPGELTYLTSSVSPFIGGTNNFFVPASGSFSIIVTGVVNDNYSGGTLYTNTADFICQVSQVPCTNISATATGTIVGFGSVGIAKIITTPNASGHISQAGDLVTYEITLTNTGTASVTGTITDIWPIHLNFISSSIPQSAVSGQTITWSGFTIPAGGTGVITLTGRLNSNYPANTPYTNTVTYTCLSPSVCNNPTSSVTGTIVGFSAVSMTKTIIAPNVSGHVSGSGDLVTYRITVSNTGTAGVTGRINDTFPGELTYLTSSVSPFIGGTNNFFVPASGSFSIIVTGVVNDNYSGGTLYTNTADFICQVSLVPCTNISATATGTIVGFGAVSIIKNFHPFGTTGVIYHSGDIVTYAVTVFNTGGTSAITGTFTDILPPQLTFVSLGIPIPFTVNGQTITITGLNIPAGQSYPMLVTAVLNGNYPANTTYTNTATYTCTSPSVCNNASASVTGLIAGFPNLMLHKTLLTGSDAGISGDVISYIVSLTSSGGTAAWSGDRCITDTFPSQVNYLTSSIAPLTVATGGCPIGSRYGTGVPATIILTGILNNNYATGTIIVNTGSVSSLSTIELFTGDNIDTASFAIGGMAEMALTKTMTGAINGISGTIVTYTLSYANHGTTGASNVVIYDTLPSVFTYLGTISGGTGVASGNLITWNIGSVSAGASGNVVFQAYYNQFVASGTITNTGLVTTTTRDIDFSTDNALHTFSIVPLPEIEIIKTILDPGQPSLGSPLSFLLTVVNNGGATGYNIIIQDILPSFITYASHTSNLSPLFYTGGLNIYTGINTPLRTDLFILGPGQSGYLIITGYLNLQPTTGISYVNTAIATGVLSASGVGLIDTNWANNISTVTGTLIPQIGCNLVISGSAPWQTSYGLDLSGQQVNLSYTLTLSGNVPLSGGTLTTTRPTDLTRPVNLPINNIITTGIALSGTSVSSWTLTGITTNRAFTALNVSGLAQFTISGMTFTCSMTTSLPAPVSCNNGYLNQGEQCDVGSFNNQTYTTVLPGLSFDASTQACDSTCHIVTTSVNNCATIYAQGLSQTSCATVSSNDPILTLDKSVSPSTNLSIGSNLTYTVVITNTSNQTAYNVQFSDIFPRLYLQYVGLVSATPASYNGLIMVNPSGQSFAGNLGTITAGQSVTLSFPATITAVPPSNTIINTANINYTNAAGSPMPPLIDSVSVMLGNTPQGACLGSALTSTYPYLQNGNASVTVRVQNPFSGSASLNINCNNGTQLSSIGSNLSLTCDYTTVGQQPTITMTVNGATSPSCTIPVTVRQNTANRCGDGYISVFEQCDMGNDSAIYNGGVIGNYLDKLGMTMPSGIYNGSMCSSSCTIQGSTVAVPACRYADTIISVMEGEYLPFARDVEVSDNSIVDSCSGAPDGSILRSSMICDFKMFNKNEEASNNQTERKITPCTEMMLKKNERNKLFEDMDPPFVQDPFGTQIFNITKALVNGGYGEYKISLDKVQYKYCKNNVAIQGNPYARVCQVNFAVTKPYMMVKTPVTQRPSDTLDDYFVLGSDTQTIIGQSEFDRYNKETSLSNLSKLTSSMSTMVNSLITKYEKLAKTVSDSSIGVGQVKKVPGKSFYIIDGDSVFEPGDEYTVPTTVVVKGNLTIVGDVPVNMLLIATGKITINAADNDCGTQTIKGIIVAKGGFTKSASSTWWNTLRDNGSPKNTKRCSRGNVHIYGVLYGPNVDNLVNSRRSHLEHWFTTKRGVNTDAEIKAERRDEIYQGASVYVEQNSSLRRSMPPGADEFLKALQVSRY